MSGTELTTAGRSRRPFGNETLDHACTSSDDVAELYLATQRGVHSSRSPYFPDLD